MAMKPVERLPIRGWGGGENEVRERTEVDEMRLTNLDPKSGRANRSFPFRHRHEPNSTMCEHENHDDPR